MSLNSPTPIMTLLKVPTVSILIILGYFEFPNKVNAVNDISETIIDLYTLNSGVELTPNCKKQATYYNEAFHSGEPWSFKMLDASSKLQSGILLGNLVDFGSFDECLAVNHHSRKNQTVIGKYCTLSIIPSKDTVARITNSLKLPPERIAAMSVQSFYGLTWSVCIPDLCTAEDAQKHFQQVIPQLLNISDLKIYASEMHCQSSKNYSEPWRKSDWMVMYCLIVLLVLTVLSTGYDCLCNILMAEKPKKLLTAFSLYQNTLSFLKVGGDGGNMKVLNGLRFLSCAWVIILHRFLLRFFTPNINTVDMQDWVRAPHSMIIQGSSVSVDTFFTVSGMLVLLTFFRSMDRDKEINYTRYYLHRYLRITPLMGGTVAVCATLLIYVGDGPFWFLFLREGMQNPCRNYWWASLLFIQNYVNNEEYCIVQTWYLSVDMQLYWISPLILYPLYRRPKVGLSILSALIVVPMLFSFYYAWINQYDGSLRFQKDLLTTKYFTKHYTSTHIRASPWFLGVALGYIIYKTKDQKVIIQKPLVIACWMLTFVILLTVVFGIYPFQQFDYPEMRLRSSSYLAFSRTAWSIAISWIIFASVHGYGGIINRFLSWSVFTIMGKLAYGMFLTHLGLQFMMVAALRHARYFSIFNDVYLTFADTGMAAAMSFVLTVGFEMPIHRVEDYFFNKLRKAKVNGAA